MNGDLSQAEQILAADITVNAAIVGVDGAWVQGRQGVAGWVALLRKALGEPVFTLEVGPIIDGVHRWCPPEYWHPTRCSKEPWLPRRSADDGRLDAGFDSPAEGGSSLVE